jgi:hypothetical protein
VFVTAGLSVLGVAVSVFTALAGIAAGVSTLGLVFVTVGVSVLGVAVSVFTALTGVAAGVSTLGLVFVTAGVSVLDELLLEVSDLAGLALSVLGATTSSVFAVFDLLLSEDLELELSEEGLAAFSDFVVSVFAAISDLLASLAVDVLVGVVLSGFAITTFSSVAELVESCVPSGRNAKLGVAIDARYTEIISSRRLFMIHTLNDLR